MEKLLKGHQAGSYVLVPQNCNGVWNIKLE